MYATKQSRKEMRRCVLADVIQRIQIVDGVTPEDALQQIKAAIADQAIRAWQDDGKLLPAHFRHRVLVCLDRPGWIYIDRESPEGLEIVPGPVDDPEDLDGYDYRTVTLRRKDVNKYWPVDEQEILQISPKKTTGLAKNYSEIAALKAARELYDEAEALGLPAPNTADAWTMMSKKGFPRPVAKKALEVPEIAQRRRKPGNPKGSRCSRTANLQK